LTSLANLLALLRKSVVAAITSSASMLAEGGSFSADAGNEIFLLIADQRSTVLGTADTRRLRMRGVRLSMFAAFGLVTEGAVMSIWRGGRR
jgi:hypothetical protein